MEDMEFTERKRPVIRTASAAVLAVVVIFFACTMALIPQTPQQNVQATIYANITSSSRLDGCLANYPCIDNRSQYTRRNSYLAYRSFGTGTWSVDMQWADGTPTIWTSYGSTAQVNQAGPSSGIGYGLGPASTSKNYHDYTRFVITGSATIQSYFGTSQAWWIPSVAGISFPITGNQGGLGGLVYPDVFSSTLAEGCTAATSAGLTLLVTQSWPSVPTQTCLAPVIAIKGASIQPASGQVFSFGSTFNSPELKTLDPSLGGSFLFPSPSPAVHPEWFGGAASATGSPVDALAGFTAAYNSLPSLGANPQGVNIVTGKISLQSTGVGTEGYALSGPLNISIRTELEGGSPSGSLFFPTSGFSASSGSPAYLFNVVNTNGTAGPGNNDFWTVISNVYVSANQNANPWIGCFSAPFSIGSRLSHSSCVTGYVGILWGGTATAPTVDNARIEDFDVGLIQYSGGACPRAEVYPTFASLVSINTLNVLNEKITESGVTQCVNTPVMSVYGSNITHDGTNYEGNSLQVGPYIGAGSTGVRFINQVLVPDCVGACTFANFKQAFLISPEATNWYVQGWLQAYPYAMIMGDPWFVSHQYNASASLLDSSFHQQTNTAGICTAGSTIPSFSDSGGSVSDGTCTWQDEGLIPQCNVSAGVSAYCWIPTTTGAKGASSGSDTGQYYFEMSAYNFYNPPPPAVGASLVSANFNTTSDQPIPVNCPIGFTHFLMRRVSIYDASTSLTTAVGGFYSSASKSGAIVANTQVYSALTSSSLFLDATLTAAVLTPGAYLSCIHNPNIYLSLTTPQGSAATANVSIQLDYAP